VTLTVVPDTVARFKSPTLTRPLASTNLSLSRHRNLTAAMALCMALDTVLLIS